MKRLLIIIIAILMFATSTFAFDIWGDHHHHKHPGVTYAAPPSDPPVTPDTPITSPVPEPASLLLLGAGLVVIAAWARHRD